LAWGTRFGSLHHQFSICDFQLQYREPVFVAFPPVFLKRGEEAGGRRQEEKSSRRWKSSSSD
jgi:hypothetical protein